MLKIYNIRLKDEPNAKLHAIKRMKDAFNLGMKEAKDKVEELLAKGVMISEQPENDHYQNRYYNLMGDYNIYHIKSDLPKIFDYDFENTDIDRNKRVADVETQTALDWYDTLSDDLKRKVDLVGEWNNPPTFASGGGGIPVWASGAAIMASAFGAEK